MAGRPLPSSPGTRTLFHHDGDKVHITRYQDVEPILERNKKEATENDGYSASRDYRRVGRVPLVVLEKVCNEMGVTYKQMMKDPDVQQKVLARLFTDPDYAHLRTAPKQVNKYVPLKPVFGPDGGVVSRV